MAALVVPLILAASFPLSCSKSARPSARFQPFGVISRGELFHQAAPGCDTQGKGAGDDVGAACGTRRIRSRDGGRTNAMAGAKGRAIACPHEYARIPALVDRSKFRVANFLSDFDTRWRTAPLSPAISFQSRPLRRWRHRVCRKGIRRNDSREPPSIDALVRECLDPLQRECVKKAV
jgi:hypothetical protein